jgi:glutathione synthase/RimK-type ligase-like ATP-grasp enzyme
MRRYEVVNHLRQVGCNCFSLYRPSELLAASIRYPVFLRNEFDHKGPTSALISDYDTLVQFVEEKVSQDVLISEFVDTSTDSLYQKYGAFIVGGEVVARHYFVSDQWNVKSSSSLTTKILEEEKDYVMNNPHKKVLAEIANSTHIDYGRIDYAFSGENLVVFEINTNPTIIDRKDLKEKFLRRDVTQIFLSHFIRALDGLFEYA